MGEGIKYCRKCGKQLNKDAKFCRYCGYQFLEEENETTPKMKYCRNCGKEIPADAKFCRYCGTQSAAEQTKVRPAGQTKNEQERRVSRPEQTVQAERKSSSDI